LPHFTSEPQQNLARFARTFFRDFFSVLPRPCVVVFDNFHEPGTVPEQRAAFAQGLEEVPERITVVVISRADPPSELARLVASGRIARIDEAELACTENEAEAILGGQPADREQLMRIQRESDGWMAALMLLREHLRRPGATLDESLGEGKDAIFQYFAGEIFNGARPENQRVLMLSAIPPSITASEAIALTGSDEAPRLLEYLFRHHLFTDRRRGERLTYHYHALFREFLIEELESRIAPGERRAATARAGHLVAARGEQSEALACFATPANGRRCAPSFTRTRSSGRARAERRRCRTGSKRCRSRCATAIPGSPTGSAVRGYSWTRRRAVPRSSEPMKRSARATIVVARRSR
jgi:ATP/maltotriose-dependent transcriptional regulator MalT